MLLRLVRGYASRPLAGVRTMRVLGAYRRAQEQLRELASEPIDLADAQLRLACSATGASPEFVGECVDRWMDRAPLDLLAALIRPGLVEFLQLCQARGIPLGVLSDYPPREKLDAMGLTSYFDVLLHAQMPEIGVFKPHPRGLLLAAERLGAEPAATLYIGDRAEVDATAARAAGMPCVIVDGQVGFVELEAAVSGIGGLNHVAAAQPSLHRR